MAGSFSSCNSGPTDGLAWWPAVVDAGRGRDTQGETGMGEKRFDRDQGGQMGRGGTV